MITLLSFRFQFDHLHSNDQTQLIIMVSDFMRTTQSSTLIPGQLQATAIKNDASGHHVVDTAHEDMIVSTSVVVSHITYLVS
jgi:hypothetical protein